MPRNFQDFPQLEHDRVETVKATISTARFERYRRPRHLSDRAALGVYLHNLQICQQVIAPLHFAEIVLRNQLNSNLVERYGTQWHQSIEFKRALPRRLQVDIEAASAKEQEKHGTPVTSDQIVSNLTLGFWAHLLSGKAVKGVWRGTYPNILPSKPSRNTADRVYRSVDRMRKFRNRVMHHEPIFDRNPTDEIDNIFKLIDWACVDTGWLVRQLAH